MKKIFVIFALFCAFFAVSCGGGSKNEDQSDSGEQQNDEDTVDTGDNEPAEDTAEPEANNVDADTDPTDDADSQPEPSDDDVDTEPTDDADSQPEPNDDDADSEPTDDADSQPEPSDYDADSVSVDEDNIVPNKNVKISLLLPTDPNYVCFDLEEEADKDYTYCINSTDKIIVSVYGKEYASDEYTFISDFNFISEMSGMNFVDLSLQVAENLSHLRIFVKVLNKNGKLKLTGGVDTIDDNPKIFLAPAGDFVRVVSNRTQPDENSLESYFYSKGSKGSAAVALKNGTIYMAGGYDLKNNEFSKKAVIFDMTNISKKYVKDLPVPLYDHVAALLDDGSEQGKVVVGSGTTENDVLSESFWIYDPESDNYEPLNLGNQPMTKAKTIAIDGDVYIVSGCSVSKAETGVYRISAKTGVIVSELFATLKTGRCNHAIADVSTVDESGNKNVRILVAGGSTNHKPEGKETPVTGENFAELVTKNSSKPVTIADRNGLDDAELMTKGLIAPAAVSVIMDDKENDETLTAVVGGYTRYGENGGYSWETNKNLFIFSRNGDNAFTYDRSKSPFECARPTAALLSSGKRNPTKHIAVNCGTREPNRTRGYRHGQIIFVLQIKRVNDFDLGMEIFSPSVKSSLMYGNQDSSSNTELIDGPAVADALGKVFMLGGQYTYQAGGYEFPETISSYAAATLPPKPIIRVSFENQFDSPMSYRNIFDKVQMNLNGTCVSAPDNQELCLEDWESDYLIRYKWEMKESPTPVAEKSKLKISDIDAVEGLWIVYDSNAGSPKKANFYGLVVTPRKHAETNDSFNTFECTLECGNEPTNNNILQLSEYFICRQKYCEKNRTKYYKINIQAETVDKKTGVVSDTADITVIPKIIPQARVVAQLSWKQGFKTNAQSNSSLYEGSAIDLNLHMIKKTSLEAAANNKMTRKEGLLGTKQRQNGNQCSSSDSECEVYWRHDDCSINDLGITDSYISSDGTIRWHASLDTDNSWGGGNYQNPETIGLGPIDSDENIINDQYLLVVGYVGCKSKYSDGINRCAAEYNGEDSAYEIDAKVEILVDGDEAPRSGTSDKYAATTKDFKIKVNEWKAIAVVKWDNGNAIVTDTKMEDEAIAIDPVNHPVCTYDNSKAVLIPFWDAATYTNYITTGNIGTCN